MSETTTPTPTPSQPFPVGTRVEFFIPTPEDVAVEEHPSVSATVLMGVLLGGPYRPGDVGTVTEMYVASDGATVADDTTWIHFDGHDGGDENAFPVALACLRPVKADFEVTTDGVVSAVA